MDAVDFLHCDASDLPKTRVGGYPAFVDRILDDYQARLRQVVPRNLIDRAVRNELQRVVPLCAAIRDVIALAVAGDRASAYGRLDAALNALGAHLRALMPSGDMSAFVNPLYRFRTAGKSPYFCGDLFHIPFYLRRIVQPMRYSVAGLPSLYLGGSTHVCWRELGEPNLSNVSVSRYEAIANTNLRVLNFGHRLPVLAAYVYDAPGEFLSLNSAVAFVVAQVACWPLIAACSVRVPDRNAADRPEYLVPQLVLEWITKNHQFHGIRYFSTHYEEYPDDPKTYMNYVFPARTTPPVGYCPDLCRLFKLTDPISWTVAKASPVSGARRPRYKTRKILDTALESEFGRAEDGLLGLPARELSSVPAELVSRIRESVQLRAYFQWESESYPRGRDLVHWFAARTAIGIPDNFLV
jgi:hypothetical protein